MDNIILKEREFKERLVELVNESKLPAFVIKQILTDLLRQVTILEEQQYQEALKQQEEKKEKQK